MLDALAAELTDAEAAEVKRIERETNHDVKAVEYFVKSRLDAVPAWRSRREFVHFACTSEDINNLSYALMLREARDQVLLPRLDALIGRLRTLAHTNAATPMMSRTHGQPATPTTLGKEIANFMYRLARAAHPLRGRGNRRQDQRRGRQLQCAPRSPIRRSTGCASASASSNRWGSRGTRTRRRSSRTTGWPSTSMRWRGSTPC